MEPVFRHETDHGIILDKNVKRTELFSCQVIRLEDNDDTLHRRKHRVFHASYEMTLITMNMTHYCIVLYVQYSIP